MAPLPRIGASLAILAAAGLLVAAGAWAGRRAQLAPFEALMRAHERSATLGGVAGDERAAMALAYDDPARAAREMDGYSWTVPNLPTPFVGVAPAPGRHANAAIDEHQFRRRAPLAQPKPPGTVRVFVTGGSTAYGTGAPSDDATIQAFLEARLARELAPRTGLVYEVVDAANPAWASTHERILIENRLSELEPDLVVSLSGNNDLHWGYLGLDVLWFRNYAESYFGALVRRLYAATGRALAVPPAPDIARPVPLDEVARRLVKNARLATAALEPTGAPYVFALQPTLAASGKALSERERRHRDAELLRARAGRDEADSGNAYFAAGYERLRTALSALALEGFRFVDLSGAFDDQPAEAEVFLDSYHFGDRGNRILADRLFEALRPLLGGA